MFIVQNNFISYRSFLKNWMIRLESIHFAKQQINFLVSYKQYSFFGFSIIFIANWIILRHLPYFVVGVIMIKNSDDNVDKII